MKDTLQYQPDLQLSFEIIELIKDKWSLKLLNRMSAGPLRFSELQRKAEPISQKVLTQCLKNLERYGLVTRIVLSTMPPQVTYELSALGASFLRTVGGICQWTSENRAAVYRAIAEFESGADG